MVAMMAQVTATEERLYNKISRGTLAKAALWGLKALTQEGKSPHQEDKNEINNDNQSLQYFVEAFQDFHLFLQHTF